MSDNEAENTTNEVAQAQRKVVLGDKKVQQGLPELCRSAAADGLVLLRNDGPVLPLKKGARVSVFGRVQNDYFYVGYGSGGDVNAPYTVNLMQGLREKDLVLDEELAGIYSKWCGAHTVSSDNWGDWPRSYEEMPLTDEMVNDAAGRSDIAVVVLGRAAGEDRECTLEKGSYYLTDLEREMLDKVTSAFQRTVVLLDYGNIMDLSWIEGYGDRISAVIYAWQGGMESGHAVADVLCGDTMPSGHLTDSIAFRYEDYPSSANFLGKKFNNYAEDIYVGYRYFRTFNRSAVQYPFGFGLAYTTFRIRAEAPRQVGETVEIDVKVTNTGSQYSGREVAQVYCSAPQGVLGKPARVLAAFAKTKELAPSESQTIKLSFSLAELASFDDSGATGHKSAWVLEAGDYVFYVGDNVCDTKEIGSISLPELKLVEQLEEACPVQPEHVFNRLVCRQGGNGSLNKDYEPVPTAQRSLKERILSRLPKAIPQTGDKGITLRMVADKQASLDEFITQLSNEELEALSRGDYTMDSHLGPSGNAGAMCGTIQSLRDKAVPAVVTTDGPSGIRLGYYTSLLPCGTALASAWDPAMVEKLAAALAKEMRMKGSDILLGPGMNIHRNPLCGRNFEYYTEDPLLNGRTAAAMVRGIQSQGVSACPKHFACNNQETERTKTDSRVSERALREIYLRGFEICVREAKPLNIMTSYNKINGVWNHYNYDLCTTILRGQWGYEGNVMTDWWMQESEDPDFPALKNSAYRVRSEVDVLMPGTVHADAVVPDPSVLDSLGQPDGLTLGELQEVARHVLRMAMASRPFCG
jgi:beta-glucosidase